MTRTQRKAVRRALELLTPKQMREALNAIAASNRARVRLADKMLNAGSRKL